MCCCRREFDQGDPPAASAEVHVRHHPLRHAPQHDLTLTQNPSLLFVPSSMQHCTRSPVSVAALALISRN